MRSAIFFLLLSMAGGTAKADWASGGGELIKDAGNPWFLQNTRVVKMCVLVDNEHFHTPQPSEQALNRAISKAIEYWKAEFNVGSLQERAGYAEVATQRFDMAACDESTDLTFQFGYLTAEQRERFRAIAKDPREVVSLAVRTSYDKVNMRGKGFVYLAPDSGDFRPNSVNMLERPWEAASGRLLLKVLTHELGHVFGVPHNFAAIGATAVHSLMSASYPEVVVDRALSAIPASTDEIPHVFSTSTGQSQGRCRGQSESWPRPLIEFLALDPDIRCLGVVHKGDRVEVTVGQTAPYERVFGLVTLVGQQQFFGFEVPMRLWLPPEQTVVPLPSGFREVNIGRTNFNRESGGIYRDAGGQVTRKVVMIVLPDGRVNVSGVLDSGEVIGIK